jgi:hypothetical protein
VSGDEWTAALTHALQDTLAHEVRSNFESMLAFAAASDDLASHLTGELARHDLRAVSPLDRFLRASADHVLPSL